MGREVKSIDLKDMVTPSWLSFLRAEWWEDSSRFVLIRYSLKGKEQELGLRLDLDKKIFLDHMDNPELDAVVQHEAENIWRVVALKRPAPPRSVRSSLPRRS